MDPSRLHLNFNGGAYNSNQHYPASNENVYPTTPSTFPQPIVKDQTAKGPNEYHSPSIQSPSGFAGANYFTNSAYQGAFGQSQYQPPFQQQGLASPQPLFQPRQGGFPTNDPTSGLAHQFQNQNLGPAPRQGSPFGRQPSPSQRPRVGGTNGQQTYGNLLIPSTSTSNGQPQHSGIDEPPEKNPEKYSVNVAKRGNVLHQLVETFFTENITRARDRNLR